MKVITARNSPLGKARSTTSRPTGTSSAPPTPWTTRAATSTCRLGDTAQASEPRLNSPIAHRNTVLVPKRSASHPEAGISKATVSR